MDPDRWRIIEATFHEALRRAPAERAAYLEQSCNGDQELIREVASLLGQSDKADPFLERPVWESAPDLLGTTEADAGGSLADIALAGCTLSHYYIAEKLAQGGMGTVWRAMDTNLRREVALKVLPGNRAFDIERFLHEGRTASALNHPNIVTIYEANSAGGIHFIAMELVRGETLAERLQAGRVPPREALRIAVQVADALAHAHAAGVVHRDLKPANIMITRAESVKVLDFGIAKQQPLVAGALADDTPLITAPGVRRGTMAYMSPEQLLAEEVDARSDIFSFGIVLYEMLTGHRPFASGKSSPLRAVLEETPSAPRTLAPEVPHRLERIMLRCLEKDPKDRYQTAAELGSDLRSLLPATQRPRPRTLWYVAAMIALVIVVMAGIPRVRSEIMARLVFPRTCSGALAEIGNESDAYQLARECLARYDKRGNIDKAIYFLNRALRIKGDYATAYAALSEANLRRYEVDKDSKLLTEARQAAESAVYRNPDLVSAHVALGASRLADGRTNEAAEEFTKAKNDDPKNARALVGLAQVAGQKDPAAAEQLFGAAAALAPADVYVAIAHGVFLYNRGQYSDAIAVWKDSLDRNPGNVRALYDIGNAYFGSGKYEDAASYHQKALEIDPTASVYTNLGNDRYYQGQYRQAVAAFEKAVKGPGSSAYTHWGNLGDAYRLTGERVKAAEAYGRAIKLAEQDATRSATDSDVLSNLSKYLAFLGDRNAAIARLSSFETLSERTPLSLFVAAIAYDAIGRRDNALHSLEAAFAKGFAPEAVEREPELRDLRSDPRYQQLRLATRNAPNPPK